MFMIDYDDDTNQVKLITDPCEADDDSNNK